MMFTYEILNHSSSITVCLMLLLSFLVIFLAISVLWVCLLTFFYKIRVGDPPFKGLYLAYRYNYFRKSSSLCFKHLSKLYPNYTLVKICYSGSKSSHVEYANGVLVGELGLNPNACLLYELFKDGMSIFKTPYISHAVCISYPIISWFPITKWLAVAIGYLKLFRFIKEYNLCGYPVLELYFKSSITIMIPLLRQDEFVVKEAERLVHGRSYSSLLNLPTVSSTDVPNMKKLFKASSSARLTKGERKG